MTDSHPSLETITCTDEPALCAPLVALPPIETIEGVDTWYRVGDWDTDEERTVTVVFRHDPLDEFCSIEEHETAEFAVQPFAPNFPGGR